MHSPVPTERFDPEPLLRPASLLGLAQWTERAALAESYSALLRQGRSHSDPSIIRHGAVVGYTAGAIRSSAFNRVFIGGEGAAPDVHDVTRVLSAVCRHDGSQPLVHIHGTDQTPAILDALAAHGFSPYRRAWVKLVREAGPIPNATTDLHVRAAHHEDAWAMAEVAILAHGLRPEARPLVMATVARPHWHSYVACDRDRIVAAGALMVRGDVGYLSMGATLPSHRARGAQSALLEERLRVAFALGCRRVFAETGVAIRGEPNTSFSNMCRMGMTPIGTRDNYARPGTRWS